MAGDNCKSSQLKYCSVQNTKLKNNFHPPPPHTHTHTIHNNATADILVHLWNIFSCVLNFTNYLISSYPSYKAAKYVKLYNINHCSWQTRGKNTSFLFPINILNIKNTNKCALIRVFSECSDWLLSSRYPALFTGLQKKMDTIFPAVIWTIRQMSLFISSYPSYKAAKYVKLYINHCSWITGGKELPSSFLSIN